MWVLFGLPVTLPPHYGLCRFRLLRRTKGVATRVRSLRVIDNIHRSTSFIALSRHYRRVEFHLLSPSATVIYPGINLVQFSHDADRARCVYDS